MTPVPMLWSIAALLGLAVCAVPLGYSKHGSRLIYAGSLIASVVGLCLSAAALLSPISEATVVLPLGLPWLGAHFRVDALSAFFLVLIGLGGSIASLFALGNGRHEGAPHRILPFFPAFLAGMNLVVLADDAFTFLVCWEFMSLSSWALVVAHHRERDNVTAGYVYLVMASFGTICLLLAFGLLAGAEGHYSFAEIRNGQIGSGLAAVAFLLVLAGTGSKAGLVPLHVWLPLAHPAAPSHVSALMSGIMTKVAIYAFIRVAFDLLGTMSTWTSVLVLTVGGITAVMGLLYAVLESDLKKFLAYSTIENVGVVFVGLGLALAFKANAMPAAAALAMTAALLHALNHSVFKSLLFFAAGAVLSKTGERDMERLGGLIHRMPKTAFLFLVGSLSISAIPPFNGFVSEWLMFQSILLSPELPSWALKFFVPATGALLALSTALAAACFVKAFGITFLGRPRSDVSEHAVETDRLSLAAMSILAMLCLLIGVLPGIFIDSLAPVVRATVGARMPVQLTINWLSIIPIGASRSSYNGLLVFVFISIAGGLAAWAIHRFASDARRRAPAWDCGYPEQSVATQYSANSFAQPIRRVFGTSVFLARERVEIPPPGSQKAARLTVEIRDLIWDLLYLPLSSGVMLTAGILNHLQFLTIRRYLSLVFIALVSLLLVLAIWL